MNIVWGYKSGFAPSFNIIIILYLLIFIQKEFTFYTNVWSSLYIFNQTEIQGVWYKKKMNLARRDKCKCTFKNK